MDTQDLCRAPYPTYPQDAAVPSLLGWAQASNGGHGISDPQFGGGVCRSCVFQESWGMGLSHIRWGCKVMKKHPKGIGLNPACPERRGQSNSKNGQKWPFSAKNHKKWPFFELVCPRLSGQAGSSPIPFGCFFITSHPQHICDSPTPQLSWNTQLLETPKIGGSETP